MHSIAVSALLVLGLAADGVGPAPAGPVAGAESPIAPTPAAASASAYEWRAVPIGGGGFITGLSMDRSGATRVARADVYGAYLWDEPKDRWTQLVTSANMPDAGPMRLNQGVYEVVVAPSDPQRIYLAMAGGFYRSTDRGQRFEKGALPKLAFDANSPFRHYGPFIAVKPDNPDVVVFGTPHDGLWRSLDGGRTWSRNDTLPNPTGGADGPSPGTMVWFTPDGSELWAAISGRGIWKSDDGGVSFQPLGDPDRPGPEHLRRGVFARDGAFFGVDVEGRRIWKFDHGQWRDLTGNPGLQPAAFAAVATNPKDGAVYVFDVGGRGYRSADGGMRWLRLSGRPTVGEKDPPWLHVVDNGFFATGDVMFDPIVPDRLWNGAGTGVYFADIGADAQRVDWKSRVRGIEELVANDVVAAPGRLPIFAAWDFGLHVRDDLTRFSTGYGPKERVLIGVQQVDWSASNPAFMVTNASDTRSCCSEDGEAVLAGYSTDGGRTWSRFASLPQPPGTNASDPWRMSYGAIAVSSDDVNNIVWAPARNRSPFYTTDRGVTWKRVVLAGEVLPDTGSYARYNFHRRTLAADRVLPATFYLAHSGDGANSRLEGLWSTEDGGRNWRQVFKGAIAPDSRYSAKLRAVPGKAGHLFFTANAEHSADRRLRRSTDGGRSWRALDNVEHVHDIAFGKAASGADYPAIYLTGRINGRYGVWRSVDDATTWAMVGAFPVGALDEVVAMDADKDVFGRVYLGFKGSGWRYGQPSACRPTPYEFGSNLECFGLQNVF
ncbi:hypothetical protein [Brevundimonas sp.]|uniref:WD40/YVTN/BNR-like repeat-containing protein n=1 Tax=Brevundimonas sp. TaxID=1871086 RepID=UPI0025B901DA|nr:hypothetical protein [Brevundimonas sp.]